MISSSVALIRASHRIERGKLLCVKKKTSFTRIVGTQSGAKRYVRKLKKEARRVEASCCLFRSKPRKVCTTKPLPTCRLSGRVCYNCSRQISKDRARAQHRMLQRQQEQKQARADATAAARKYGWKNTQRPETRGHPTADGEAMRQAVNMMPSADLGEFMSRTADPVYHPGMKAPAPAPTKPLPSLPTTTIRSTTRIRRGPREIKPAIRHGHVAAGVMHMKGSIHGVRARSKAEEPAKPKSVYHADDPVPSDEFLDRFLERVSSNRKPDMMHTLIGQVDEAIAEISQRRR